VIVLTGGPWLTPTSAEAATPDDVARVAEVLGRRPDAAFAVAARAPSGEPTVIINAPFLSDGTPMPTRWWLVDPGLRTRIGTLESEGGVRDAEAAVDPEELRRAHDTYAALRDEAIGADHTGPRPSGGVGGTRRGVKCLHAHYAWFLAGGHDPVGAWVHQRLTATGPTEVIAATESIAGESTASTELIAEAESTGPIEPVVSDADREADGG